MSLDFNLPIGKFIAFQVDSWRLYATYRKDSWYYVIEMQIKISTLHDHCKKSKKSDHLGGTPSSGNVHEMLIKLRIKKQSPRNNEYKYTPILEDG